MINATCKILSILFIILITSCVSTVTKKELSTEPQVEQPQAQIAQPAEIKEEKSSTEPEKWLHAPFEGEDCSSCHEIDEENIKPLAEYAEMPPLLEEGRDLCFACHDEEDDSFIGEHRHEPVTEDCITCHNPHESENKFGLVDKVPNLCFVCHSDIEEQINNKKNPAHTAVKQGMCLSCHKPHSSKHQKLLSNELKKLCFSCHQATEKILKKHLLEKKK